MVPGLLDVGLEDETDNQFVEVRRPERDANAVQFWVQTGIDTRIRDIHPKVFMTNEIKNTAVSYAGDY